MVEKPGQRRKIEICSDILALVKNADAEPSNEAAVSDSSFRGGYAWHLPSLLQTSRKNCQRANTTMDLSAVRQKF